MNTALKKHGVNVLPGTVIRGKWHHHEYTIVRKIGEGVVGTVYLVRGKGQNLALKISEQSHSITIEVNVLKSVQKVQGNRLGPLIVDVDDWESPNGRSYSFYVMEYVQGENIVSFIKRNGPEWIGAFIFQLLDQLIILHDQKWVFGDLKVEHILIESSPPKLRLIDFGGTTKFDRAIKEFTEFYDRGYWQLGSRKAEPSYDLFSLVLVFIHLFHGRQFPRGSDPKRTLFTKLKGIPALKVYEPIFKKALLGRYTNGREMKADLKKALYEQSNRRVKYHEERKRFFVEFGVLSLIVALYSLLAFFMM